MQARALLQADQHRSARDASHDPPHVPASHQWLRLGSGREHRALQDRIAWCEGGHAGEAGSANLLDSIEQIDTLVCALDDAGKQALEIENLQKRADFYAHTLIPIMDDLRSVVDYTETITDRTYWPVPSYNNMLFYV